MKIAIVGLGRVGIALGNLLYRNGWEICSLCAREQQVEKEIEASLFIGVDREDCSRDNIINADLVLITVPDDVIASTVSELYEQNLLSKNTILIHFSGMHSASVMRMNEMLNPCVSLHPLQSIASAQQGVELLPKSYFTVEGDEEGVMVATELCQRLGAEVRLLSSGDKVLYHAAAVMASNCLTALCASAIDLFKECNFSEQDAKEMLLPLIQGSVDNLKRMPAHKALTGPISRGDITTVERQIHRLKQQKLYQAEIYRLLGNVCIDLAEEDNRLTEPDIKYLRSILK